VSREFGGTLFYNRNEAVSKGAASLFARKLQIFGLLYYSVSTSQRQYQFIDIVNNYLIINILKLVFMSHN